MRDAGGDDDLLGAELLAVARARETSTVADHRGHGVLLEVGHVPPLEVQAVGHEHLKWDRQFRRVVGQAVLEAVVRQGGAAFGADRFETNPSDCRYIPCGLAVR